MEAIEGLDRDLTVMMIAHRLTTVRHCDTLVQIEGGKIFAKGDHDTLIQSNESFRRLARSVELRAKPLKDPNG